jgi:F-type H+-transporting ATPase subunit delta
MTNNKVAFRYAKAILLLAQETKQTEIILQDFEFINNLLINSKDFYAFTQNPIIRPSKKVIIINELFKGKISDLTLKFLVLVINKNRDRLLKSIITSYKDQYNEINNRLEIEIFTAKELNQNVQSSILAKVQDWTGKIILPKFTIDSKIIGGIQIKFSDYFYDASIKNQLENLYIKLVS